MAIPMPEPIIDGALRRIWQIGHALHGEQCVMKAAQLLQKRHEAIWLIVARRNGANPRVFGSVAGSEGLERASWAFWSTINQARQ